MENQFECVISADLMRRALLGISKEETRYYLNGVHVSAAPEGGAVITATDGHLLITLHDPDGIVSGEGIVMLNKQMKAALKTSGVLLEKRVLAIRTTNGVGRAFVADMPSKGKDEGYSPYSAAREVLDEPDRRVQAAQFGPLLIDGSFPDWRRVVPTKLRPDAPIPPLDQVQLARIAEALCSNGRKRDVLMTATGDTPAADPVLVTVAATSGAPSALAVLMPIRNDSAAASIPAWAQRPQTPMAAE